MKKKYFKSYIKRGNLEGNFVSTVRKIRFLAVMALKEVTVSGLSVPFLNFHYLG